MKTRAALSVLALAGLAASANAQTIGYTWTWSEVNAGTSTPVAVSNGQIDPGEGARLSLTATITPGIGSPATYQAPPAPGSGTIAGLGSVFFDLFGTNANGGTWSVNRRATGWALGGIGDPQANGDLTAGSAGQFVLPGFIALSTNPVVGIWAMTWTPADYSARTASFQSAAAAAGGANHSSILIQYGEDPNTGDPLYVGRFVNGNFGGSGNIPIVPSPASLALLGLGGLAAARRRR